MSADHRADAHVLRPNGVLGGRATRWLASFVLAVSAVLAGLTVAQGVGDPAPDFRLPTLEGEIATLDDFEGAPLMLNFWATWCPPCREELPLFQQVAAEASDLQVFLINAGESRERAERYFQANDLDMPTAVNPGTGRPADTEDTLDVARRYRVRGMPTTFFIDAEGVIQSVFVGEISATVLSERLAAIGVAWEP